MKARLNFRIQIFCLHLISFYACQKQEYNFNNFAGENVNKYQEKINLEFDHSLEFEIDSLFSVNSIHAVIPFKDGNVRYIGIFQGREVFIYELGTSQLIKKIAIKKEGPNAVKTIDSFDGIAIQSLDTIYLVTNTGGLSYIIDDTGSVIEKIAAPVETSKSNIYDYGFIRSSIINNKLFIPTYGFSNTADFTKVPTRFAYDLIQKTFEPAFYYPDIYNDFYWGYNTLLRFSSCDYNPFKESYYLSYAIDPHIYIYDKSFSLKGKKILGSNYFSSLKPQDEDPNKRFANEPPNDDYFMQLSYFAGGYYHPELNYYLRFTRIGIDKNRDQGVRFSIIIADNELNKVGEYLIPSHYQLESFFMTEGGIAFQNMDKYDLNLENKLVFDVLKFVKTE